MKVFIDLGTYDGDSLDVALRLYKNFDRFYAFEPLKKNFKILRERFKNNGKVILNNTATDVVTGKSELFLGDEYGDLGGSLCKEKINCFKDKTELVDTIDISNFIMGKFNLKDKIILKIDIEEKEYDILEKMIIDGSIKYIDRIFCEWHWQRLAMAKERHDKLIKKLNRLGFFVTGVNELDEFLPHQKGRIKKAIRCTKKNILFGAIFLNG